MIRLLLFCLGIVLVTADAGVAQTFDPAFYYQIRPRHTNKCLDVVGVSALNGAQLQQYDCNAGAQPNQLWTIQPAGGGTFRLVSAVSAKCIDIPFGSPSNGELAQQWDCNLATSQANQLFVLAPSPTAGYFRVWGLHSPSGVPKCLDVQGVSPANGALIQQWDCGPAANANQDMAIVPARSRGPFGHLKAFGYYGVMDVSTAIGIKNHVNNVVITMASIGDLATLAPHHIKGKVVISDLFRVAPKSGDDIYSDCDPNPNVECNDGGLLRNFASKWNEMKAAIDPHVNAIEMFYLLDEPYWNLHHQNQRNNFTKADVNMMLTLAANLVSADYPNIPISVVEAAPMIFYNGGVTFPEAIDWVGFDCYGEIASCADGLPYMTLYNGLKALLRPEQRIIIVPHGMVQRTPNPDPTPPDIDLSARVTTPAEQNALVGKANFYMTLALSDPRVVAVLVWHGPTRLVNHASDRWHDGLIIGTLDMPIVKDKWTFLARAAGFGKP